MRSICVERLLDSTRQTKNSFFFLLNRVDVDPKNTRLTEVVCRRYTSIMEKERKNGVRSTQKRFRNGGREIGVFV